MRILMVPNTFFPDPPGGTEVGVCELAKALLRRGVDVAVAAPSTAERQPSNYEWEGIPVYRYPVDQLAEMAGSAGEVEPGLAASFAALLEEVKPDLVSLHAWTPGVGASQIHSARARQIPVIVACHLVNVVCARGSGMRWGRTPCDLVLDQVRCTACVLHSGSVPRPLALVMSVAVPNRPEIDSLRGQSRIMRVLTLVGKTRRALTNRRQWWAQTAAFVVQSPWFVPVLIRNGIPAQQVLLAPTCLYRAPVPPSHEGKELRINEQRRVVIAFLGRLTSSKGAELLVRAARRIPRTAGDLEVRIYGIIQGQREKNCKDVLRQLIGDDARVRLLDPVYGTDLWRALTDCDVLCVPSRVQDMRPQVILEAFAAGLPVVAASVGGIRDLIRHEENGLLVPPDDVSSLRRAILRLLREPELLLRLRNGVVSPTGIDDLATFTQRECNNILDASERHPVPGAPDVPPGEHVGTTVGTMA